MVDEAQNHLSDALLKGGQAHVLAKKSPELFTKLRAVDQFYSELGGLDGYIDTSKKLLKPPSETENITLEAPHRVDIRELTDEVREAVNIGIEALEWMAEIYPVGGAADRLGTGQPAAKFKFLGKDLLTRLIEDLNAREHLFFQRMGRKIEQPIVMMTSEAKENETHIRQILEERNYFGRDPEKFFIISQPSVPTFDLDGKWVLDDLGHLVMKPGGHGVIWKLARSSGVFEKLQSLGVKSALVRQINNPVASTDYGILALIGFATKENKALGFASCPRIVNAKEGMNVVKCSGGKRSLTNVEYCDLERYGIQDEPSAGCNYSKFPSNTNVLYIRLDRVIEASKKLPFPGLLVNASKEKKVARLESTMQNIADVLDESEVILTYNKRRKTISTTKRLAGIGSLETPEHCEHDIRENARELLHDMCGMELPEHFTFQMHPALGPLWEDIAKKIRGGKMHEGSSLIIEAANVYLENVTINGSLTIKAKDVTGVGQCVLKDEVITGNRVIEI
ncbi:MAG: hypothetical protein SP1CHLAM54_01620 [Chlamydiia bacterium]|nr:hypothetical protein [Chlamydiia bacterium]MCH9615080.1 hypothetical protein [Chlamydiia bacterium]MCH9628598.1 hypothetical protein [Chlamydiia bacterium]